MCLSTLGIRTLRQVPLRTQCTTCFIVHHDRYPLTFCPARHNRTLPSLRRQVSTPSRPHFLGNHARACKNEQSKGWRIFLTARRSGSNASQHLKNGRSPSCCLNNHTKRPQKRRGRSKMESRGRQMQNSVNLSLWRSCGEKGWATTRWSGSKPGQRKSSDCCALPNHIPTFFAGYAYLEGCICRPASIPRKLWR